MYIDTHCHVFKEYYEDIDKVLEECKNNKVNQIILSGCDKKSILEGVELIRKYSNVFMTIGYHPDEVDKVTDKDLVELEKLVKTEDKIIGIGEIGLDYYWVKDNKEQQKELFIKQLEIAKKLDVPIVIHSREATKDTYDILKEYNLKGIIHCFSGSLETAKEYIKLGYKIGIGGVLTFKNTNLKEIVKEIPLESITLETDSPYLAPTPYRGKQNTPAYIPLIVEELSIQKNVTKEHISEVTTKTVKDLFDLENLL